MKDYPGVGDLIFVVGVKGGLYVVEDVITSFEDPRWPTWVVRESDGSRFEVGLSRIQNWWRSESVDSRAIFAALNARAPIDVKSD